MNTSHSHTDTITAEDGQTFDALSNFMTQPATS